MPGATSPSSEKQAEAERILQDAARTAAKNAERHAARIVQFKREFAEVKTMNPDEVRRQEEAAARAHRMEARDTCFRLAQVPQRYKAASLSKIDGVPPGDVNAYRIAVQQLMRLQSVPAVVAMIGTIGAGKTWLACGLINAFCDSARSARYITAFDYILAVRQSYSANAPRTQEQVEAHFVAFSLLVLDEMQVRAGSDNEEMLLLRLIDKRYQAGRATLMVSNHDSKESFHDRIDARIADRMRDGGGCIICNWPSLRGRINPAA